ncbi:Protein CBG18423 [Caenorhabditis briggsae]|uniref:Uncharacterized protein n=2 Tax=Caenorhabditis briggsae TaxID=6238 RepID=A0AAE9DI01_CAEBR|nr:Protein CBG18423 [Caenorhabditis briggsae]ULU03926.1 hypothetical protein L3Y34_017015 [Caenorhabditis briggsae]UMM15942.1 hypothetical protein L5515_013168 [Caenorhabditis briggsae]CAP35881.1 Protein CBG18423 [Caenorhabditis briggsae]
MSSFSNSLLLITISLITITLVESRYNAYQTTNYNNRGGYYQGYRTPYNNRGYNNYNYSNRGYNGYRNQGYQYPGYGANQYRNYYYPQYAQATQAPAPRFQPSLADLLFGGMRQSAPSYSSNGINYDSYGNSFVGTKDNGIYLFCNGKGCPGRG